MAAAEHRPKIRSGARRAPSSHGSSRGAGSAAPSRRRPLRRCACSGRRPCLSTITAVGHAQLPYRARWRSRCPAPPGTSRRAPSSPRPPCRRASPRRTPASGRRRWSAPRLVPLVPVPQLRDHVLAVVSAVGPELHQHHAPAQRAERQRLAVDPRAAGDLRGGLPDLSTGPPGAPRRALSPPAACPPISASARIRFMAPPVYPARAGPMSPPLSNVGPIMEIGEGVGTGPPWSTGAGTPWAARKDGRHE